MAIVNLKVAGHDYQIACGDGEEEHVRMLADEINDRIHSLTFKMKNRPSEGMCLLMAALTMADELSENKREIESLARNMHNGQQDGDQRLEEVEAAMATTLEELAHRIEKIAGQIEVG